ncbi:MAG: hypothetical protein ACTHM0_09800 [Sphingomonas sp.]
MLRIIVMVRSGDLFADAFEAIARVALVNGPSSPDPMGQGVAHCGS